MSMIDEYRETLRGLFTLLEQKKTLRREKRWDIEARSDLDHHIAVIESEIYSTQDVLRALERRERDDGVIHYGYRRRVRDGVHDRIDGVSDFHKNAPKRRGKEKEGSCPTE